MKAPLVIKLGGAGAADDRAVSNLALEIGELVSQGTRVTVVHGGGAQLTRLSERLNIPTRIVGGRRITDDGTIVAAKMAFAGVVGPDLAATFHRQRVRAVHLSGVAAGILQVVKRPPQVVQDTETGATVTVDFGWVGDVRMVDPTALHALMNAQVVPLVASLGVDSEGAIYNVNADTVAAAIAAALGGRLVMLTDVGGVYRKVEDPASRIDQLSRKELGSLLKGGTATGGMLPKLAAVQKALEDGALSVCIAGWGEERSIDRALAGDRGTTVA